jgi:hypothetical protein
MKPFSFVITFVIIGSGFFAWRSLEPHTTQDIQEGKTELINKLVHSGSWSSLYTIILSVIVLAVKTSEETSSSSSSIKGDDSGFDITEFFGGNDD